MSFFRRHRALSAIFLAVALVILVTGGYSVYLAGSAGYLPWQEEPTRIPITPFADIPGFTAPTAPATRPATPST